MQEYVTDAIVLRKDPLKDLDGRYYFFTKRFGKIVARATSTRKITSKLAGHLEPGNLSQVRFFEKKGTQIVDALKDRHLAIMLPDLGHLSTIIPEGEPDDELWVELLKERFS